MGFEAIDLWLAHLHWSWATPEHIAIARDLISRYNLAITSLAGGFGTNREEFEAACKLAACRRERKRAIFFPRWDRHSHFEPLSSIADGVCNVGRTADFPEHFTP